MMLSLKALAAAGVEGVVVEIWWGVVERNQPRVYDWRGYRELVMMACMCGLKVRAVLAFHQHGSDGDDLNGYVVIEFKGICFYIWSEIYVWIGNCLTKLE